MIRKYFSAIFTFEITTVTKPLRNVETSVLVKDEDDTSFLPKGPHFRSLVINIHPKF